MRSTSFATITSAVFAAACTSNGGSASDPEKGDGLGAACYADEKIVELARMLVEEQNEGIKFVEDGSMHALSDGQTDAEQDLNRDGHPDASVFVGVTPLGTKAPWVLVFSEDGCLQNFAGPFNALDLKVGPGTTKGMRDIITMDQPEECKQLETLWKWNGKDYVEGATTTVDPCDH